MRSWKRRRFKRERDVRGAAFESKAPLEHPRKPAFGWSAVWQAYMKKRLKEPNVRASSPFGFQPLFLRVSRVTGCAGQAGQTVGVEWLRPRGTPFFLRKKRAVRAGVHAAARGGGRMVECNPAKAFPLRGRCRLLRRRMRCSASQGALPPCKLACPRGTDQAYNPHDRHRVRALPGEV